MTKLTVSKRETIEDCDVCGTDRCERRVAVTDRNNVFYICERCLEKIMEIFPDEILVLEEEYEVNEENLVKKEECENR
ncbi:MAG: hypothetical protein QW491_09455 [Thermoproteota archaeon]